MEERKENLKEKQKEIPEVEQKRKEVQPLFILDELPSDFPIENIRSFLFFLSECILTGKHFDTKDITEEMTGRTTKEMTDHERRFAEGLSEHKRRLLRYKGKNTWDLYYRDKFIDFIDGLFGIKADRLIDVLDESIRSTKRLKETDELTDEEQDKIWANTQRDYNNRMKRTFLDKVTALEPEITKSEQDIFNEVLLKRLQEVVGQDVKSAFHQPLDKGWKFECYREDERKQAERNIDRMVNKVHPQFSVGLTDGKIGISPKVKNGTIKRNILGFSSYVMDVSDEETAEGDKTDRKQKWVCTDFDAMILEQTGLDDEDRKRLYTKIRDEKGKEIPAGREKANRNSPIVLTVMETLMAEVMLLSDNIFMYKFPLNYYEETGEEGILDETDELLPLSKAVSYKKILESGLFEELLCQTVFHVIFKIFESTRLALKNIRPDSEMEQSGEATTLQYVLDILQYRIFPLVKVLLSQKPEDIGVTDMDSAFRQYEKMQNYLAGNHGKLEQSYEKVIDLMMCDDFSHERNMRIEFFRAREKDTGTGKGILGRQREFQRRSARQYRIYDKSMEDKELRIWETEGYYKNGWFDFQGVTDALGIIEKYAEDKSPESVCDIRHIIKTLEEAVQMEKEEKELSPEAANWIGLFERLPEDIWDVICYPAETELSIMEAEESEKEQQEDEEEDESEPLQTEEEERQMCMDYHRQILQVFMEWLEMTALYLPIHAKIERCKAFLTEKDYQSYVHELLDREEYKKAYRLQKEGGSITEIVEKKEAELNSLEEECIKMIRLYGKKIKHLMKKFERLLRKIEPHQYRMIQDYSVDDYVLVAETYTVIYEVCKGIKDNLYKLMGEHEKELLTKNARKAMKENQ